MTPFERQLSAIPRDDHYAIEERAAMIECEGATRPDSERMALKLYWKEHPDAGAKQ